MIAKLSPYMQQALVEAEAAGRRGEVPVGAVIVDPKAGRILSSTGNRSIELSDPTAHAEMLAIRQAAASRGNQRLEGCDLYVTLEPCTMCAGAISFARINRLYFAAEDVKGGAVENGVLFFRSATCHHAPEVYGGIGEQPAARILRKFFQERRD